MIELQKDFLLAPPRRDSLEMTRSDFWENSDRSEWVSSIRESTNWKQTIYICSHAANSLNSVIPLLYKSKAHIYILYFDISYFFISGKIDWYFRFVFFI